MRIYLKHIFNSIKNKPLQPIIIVLCIAMAVAVFVSAYIIKDVYIQYDNNILRNEVGYADIKVTVGASSTVRYMETEKLDNILQEDGSSFGMYALSLFYITDKPESYVNLKMVDFNKINDFFDFSILEWGTLNTSNVHESALISESFATQNNIKIGDRISLGVTGFVFEYRVQGILKNQGLMSSSVTDVLVSHRSVLKALRARYGFYLVEEAFEPSNILLVKLNSGVDLKNVKLRLEASSYLSNQKVSYAVTSASSGQSIITVVLYFLAALCTLLSVLLIYSCLTVISANRSAQNSLFCSVGASKASMSAMLYTEITIYALVGSAIGVGIGALLINLYGNILHIAGVEIVMGLQDVLLGFAFGLGVSFAVVTIILVKDFRLSLEARLSGAHRTYKRVPLPIVFALLSVCVIVFPLFFAVPIGGYVYLFVILFLCLTVLTAIALPYITTGFARGIDLIFDKFNAVGLKRLSVKSSASNIGTQNCCRIVCLMLALLLLCGYAYNFALLGSEEMSNFIKGDYVVTNISEEGATLASQVESAEVKLGFYRKGALLSNGINVVLVSAADSVDTIINCKAIEGISPKGDQLYLAESIADSIYAKKGDTVNIAINGIVYPFVLVDTFSSIQYFGVIDCAYVNESYDMATFTLREGRTKTELYEELCNTYAAQSVLVIAPDAILKKNVNIINSFLDLARMFFVFLAIVGVLGCANSYIDHLISRKDEFLQLKNIGVNKKDKVLLLLQEACVNLICVVIIGILLGHIFIQLSGLGLKTFGVDFT